jgi:hypothetical protein
MPDIKESAKTKDIASNTLFLFVRMLVITFLNLYIVRVIIKGLGVEDYGVFNTIAGVVMIASFLTGVLSLSIQRFFSFYIGKNDIQKQTEIYSSCIHIIGILSIIIFFIFETVGLWFVNTQLVIPVARMSAVIWLYQFTIFTFIFSLFQIPYTAAIFAHEDIGVYTVVSTIECLLRLGAAILIGEFMIDNLSFYGVCLLISSIIIFTIYMWYGKVHYEGCHYHKTTDRKLYKELLFFSSWTLFGNVANIGMLQGNIILLNIFFGGAVNAAFGVALQINNAFGALCNGIIIPLRPAMIKAYAEENFNYLNKLFFVGNKLIFYAFLAIGTPIILEMPNILNWWLNITDDNFILFARLIIIYIVCLSMNNPITTIIQATGKVKEYHLKVESITLLCLPLSWIFFTLHLPSYFALISMIGISVLAHIIRLFCLRKYYRRFSISSYVTTLIIPGVIILILGVGSSYLLQQHIDNNILRILFTFLYSPTFFIVFALLLGTNKSEKKVLYSYVNLFITKCLCR